MKKLLMVVAAVLVVGIIAACSPGATPVDPATPTPGGTTMTIYVHPGDTFEVSLDSNPTTGYKWDLASENASAQLVDRRYEATSTDLVGSGGKDIFTFRALETASGPVHLEFNYHRPWESTVLKSATYDVVIR